MYKLAHSLDYPEALQHNYVIVKVYDDASNEVGQVKLEIKKDHPADIEVTLQGRLKPETAVTAHHEKPVVLKIAVEDK